MKKSLDNSLGFRAVKSCEECITKCSGGFRKVASLYGSGAAIYLHTQSTSDKYDKTPQVSEFSRNLDTFIVHNTSDTEISKSTIVKELYNYKTKCITCKGIIRRVRTLLEEVRTIRKNETYAICDHCKRSSVKCKRCEYVLGKFEESKTEEREQLFKQWLAKVKQLLETISKGNICQYRLSEESSDAAELDKLMKELNSPMLAQRQLEIGAFPPMEFQENLAQSKDMLQELIQKLKYESVAKRYTSDDSLSMPASGTGCVCKYLMDKKIEQRKVLEPLAQQEAGLPKLTRVPSTTNLYDKSKQKGAVFKEHRAIEKDKSKIISSTTVGSGKEKSTKTKGSSITETSVREKSTKARKGSSTTERTETEKTTKARKGSSTDKTSATDKENKPTKEKKPKKPMHSEESKLFKKLVAERAKNKEKAEKQPKETKTIMPSFGELPRVRSFKRRQVVEDFSESILECKEGIIRSPREMIAGEEIVSFREHNEVLKTDSVQPLLFKLEADCPPSLTKEEEAPSSVTRMDPSALKKKSFIQMNVYRMLPVSHNNWFTRHRYKGTMFYDSGEKLAMIEEDGQGKWFYKNGMVALEYYKPEEMFVQRRCVVYSYEACIRKPRSQTILACFDYLGNGVVYDCQGNERLKYNQTEGHLIDKKIGPPGFWKWHSLNDPPVLHKAFIDTYYQDRTNFEPKSKAKDEDEYEKTVDDAKAAMLAIEFDNFVKEKADKLMQAFKPFQIRMKTVKINDYFSLRVIDQANIYLLFRDGALTLKLNLGMLLQSKEIIDSDCAELSCVGTPYDRHPARSESVHRLQGILLAAKGKKQDCAHCFTPDNSM